MADEGGPPSLGGGVLPPPPGPFLCDETCERNKAIAATLTISRRFWLNVILFNRRLIVYYCPDDTKDIEYVNQGKEPLVVSSKEKLYIFKQT